MTFEEAGYNPFNDHVTPPGFRTDGLPPLPTTKKLIDVEETVRLSKLIREAEDTSTDPEWARQKTEEVAEAFQKTMDDFRPKLLEIVERWKDTDTPDAKEDK